MATKTSRKNLEKARKLLAKKKGAKKSKRSYPIGQNPPQSKAYTQEADQVVSAKATGWRWTEEGAKRLGKSEGAKPTGADIIKYRSKKFKVKGKRNNSGPEGAGDGSFRYLYNEKRADKADLKKTQKLAKGGQAAPQRESYSKRGDKQVKAKPVGYRYNEAGVKRLGVKPYSKPTQEHIEKYMDKYVYFENRKDKSDLKPNQKFGEGGKSEMSHYKVGDAIFVDYDDAMNYCDEHKLPYSKIVKTKEYAKGGQAPAQSQSYSPRRDKEERAKPVGYRYNEVGVKRLGVKPYSKPTQEHIEKYMGKYVYWENRKDKSDMNPRNKYEYGGIMQSMLGGVNADPRFDIYSPQFMEKGGGVAKGYEKRDAEMVWNAWSEKQRHHFLRDHMDYIMAHGEDWDSSTVKSEFDELGDWTLAALIDHVREGQYAQGGQTHPQSEVYNEFRDMEKTAKPVGYRYTNAMAKRLGVDPHSKPTQGHIEKYGDSGKVYWENRADKSDMNPRKKYEDGGESYARGGSPKISNNEAKDYTENQLDFRANNLEGKTLENGDYVVLSYWYYPIWFWCKREGKWYGNTNKFSQTTARHISSSRPTYDATMLSRADLDERMAKSLEGKDYKAMGGVLESMVVTQ